MNQVWNKINKTARKIQEGIVMKELQNWLKTEERTMSYLARKCNVSCSSVKNWLENKHYPSKKHRTMIRDITGVEV